MFFMLFMAIHNMLSTAIHLHGHSHRITILSPCDGSRIAASSASRVGNCRKTCPSARMGKLEIQMRQPCYFAGTPLTRPSLTSFTTTAPAATNTLVFSVPISTCGMTVLWIPRNVPECKVTHPAT